MKNASRKKTTKKDPAAVALGRKGGLKGGKARMALLTSDERSALASKSARARLARLTPEERSALARKAVTARWSKRHAERLSQSQESSH